MMHHISRLTLLLGAAAALLFPSCQTPPPLGYEELPEVIQERNQLRDDLIRLLPEEQKNNPAAIKEAQQLADISYKAAAAIGRINKPTRWPGWRNNAAINSSYNWALERGLCWHYQHDMYRELRRTPLTFFQPGCCVYKEKTSREHNCVYLAAKNDGWPHAIILDAWKRAGRLVTLKDDDIDHDYWADKTRVTEWLDLVYPIGHSYPIEHWATVRSDEHWSKHLPSYTAEAQVSKQGRLMQENMRQGLKERNGNPVPY